MRRTVATALVGLLAAPAAFAQCSQNGWCLGAETDEFRKFLRIIGGNARYVTVEERTIYSANRPDYNIRVQFDCQAWTSRDIFSDGTFGRWRDSLPGTVGEGVQRVACRR